MDDLAQRLVAQVGAGTDAVIGTLPETARGLLAAAMPGLAAAGDVIVAGSPTAELSLSALIAAISGQPDFGGQDDSVLELGFKRLTGPGRTVLVIQAPVGVSRSALRYLQHMGRLAPRLILVVFGSPPLDFMLAEPGFAALRTRLRAAAPLEQPAAPSLPSREVVLAPSHPHLPHLLFATAVREPPRRSVLWIAATALGLAAIAGGALLVYGSPFASWGQERTLAGAMPMIPALVPAPPVREAALPALAEPAGPHLAKSAAPELAARSAVGSAAASPAPTSIAALPPLLPPPPSSSPSAPVAVSALPPLLKPDRTPPTRHVDVAHAQPGRWPRSASRTPHESELARYAGESMYAEPPPVWIVPEPRRRETPYIGTYAVDPYGVRVFRYDP